MFARELASFEEFRYYYNSLLLDPRLLIRLAHHTGLVSSGWMDLSQGGWDDLLVEHTQLGFSLVRSLEEVHQRQLRDQ